LGGKKGPGRQLKKGGLSFKEKWQLWKLQSKKGNSSEDSKDRLEMGKYKGTSKK